MQDVYLCIPYTIYHTSYPIDFVAYAMYVVFWATNPRESLSRLRSAPARCEPGPLELSLQDEVAVAEGPLFPRALGGSQI